MCLSARHSTLAIFFICAFLHARSQTSRCDSIYWNFDVNQFAIDGDNLLADFAEKGWTQEFFQTNEIDVTIYGVTDCPGTYEYNSRLAGNRALYLRNYFEVSAFPKLTIENSYSIPERNCVKPGQGYNRADRVTALKVCWVGDLPSVKASTTTAISNEVSKAEPDESLRRDEGKVESEGDERNAQDPVEVKNEIIEVDSTQLQAESVVENIDSLARETAAVEKVDTLASITPDNILENAIENMKVDSINVALLDSTLALPIKPKKTFSLESNTEVNMGDELIVEGLNFYPGSHRTLPEAKPILKKLLQTLQQNPTLKIEIQGHVCCASKPNEDGLDDETGDFKLSWNRAQYVRDYLIQNGIPEERISYRGFAMTRPLVYPEKTIQDQIKNRRVEIFVIAE